MRLFRKNRKPILSPIKIEGMYKEDISEENRNRVISTDMPDGENYFQGVAVHKMPNPKTGGYMTLPAGVWTIHFDDLKPGAGLFTQSEAEYYVNEIIALDGVLIRPWNEVFDNRERLKN